MITGRSRKWRNWRQHIADRCDVLTRGISPPISLQEIFIRCNVKKVVFQPLLVEAALAINDDSFVVFVNCDESSKSAYQLAFNSADLQGRYLPGRIRFSLAHELIHTFFYDTEKHPYVNRLNSANTKVIESLESACNFGASLLLLPTRPLKTDTDKKDILSLNNIIHLARKYQVSIECLITRLERLEEWTPKRGVIALVRETVDGFRVRAIAKSVAVRELFNNVYVNAAFDTVFGGVSFGEVKQRNTGVLNFDLTYPKEASFNIAKCKMEYHRVSSDPTTYVLAVSIYDQPSQITTHKRSNDAEKHIAKLRQTIKQLNASRSGSVAP